MIDGDLRTCQVNEILKVNYEHDLVEVIEQKRLNLDDLQNTLIDNLKVIGSNHRVANSSEILSSKFLPTLIDYYKQYFDYVIVVRTNWPIRRRKNLCTILSRSNCGSTSR